MHLVAVRNIILGLVFFIACTALGAQCPDSRLIQPCQCQEDHHVASLTCAHLQSIDQLRKIFDQPFPVNQLWHLTIKNSNLNDLDANVFSDKSFTVILFQNVSGIAKIKQHAFAASVERLRVLTFDSCPLTELSVQGIDDLENLVDFEVTSSVDQLTDFPSLPNLQYLHLYGNRFQVPPKLPELPKLHSLWLNSGKLTSLAELELSNLPSLRKLVLFGNKLRGLNDGDLHFNSPRVDLIDLSDNDLSENISPKAIRGITSNTVIDLKKTNITRLEETTFRPILTNFLKGTGHVQLHGTMLSCDCDSFAWLLGEPKLLAKISQNSKCSDGVNLHLKLSRINCSNEEKLEKIKDEGV